MTEPTSEDVRQIIVMRKDLPMTSGKMIAQGAHASMKVLLDAALTWGGMSKLWGMDEGRLVMPFVQAKVIPLTGDIGTWLTGAFAKICVRVESEAELEAIYEKAGEAGLLRAMIVDAGRTAFKGVPTKTCCAIGPAPKSKLDPITGHLKLL